MRFLVAVAASLVFDTQPISAQEGIERTDTAEHMLSICDLSLPDTIAEVSEVVCISRLWGVGQVMIFNCQSEEAGYRVPEDLKMSGNISHGAARQAFINYMRDNPQDWGLHWAQVASFALSQTFPCEN